jgi:hypothetical protein
MSTLNDIILEEDYMIQQLDLMDAELDKYIEMDNRDSGRSKTSNDEIYTYVGEITKIVDNVQKDLDEINTRMMQNNLKSEENLRTMTYENTRMKENINIDVNHFNLDSRSNWTLK